MTPTLRDYQLDAVADVERQIQWGRRRILLNSPCGSGKTVTFCHLAHRAVVKGCRVLILAHALELIDQASAKLDDAGLTDHGIIKAGSGRPFKHGAPVQVASIQTVYERREFLDLEQYDFVVIDECHRTMATMYLDLVSRLRPDAIVLGATGTPIRLDARPLGNLYDVMVTAITIPELIARGYLVPTTVYSGAAPNTSGLRIGKTGDYSRHALEKRANTVTLRGDIVKHWHELARDRATLALCVHVEHSRNLTAQFQAAGARWAHVDGKTAESERREVWRRLAAGDLQGVCNVGITVEGVDIPEVSCIIEARPTASLGRRIQSVARGIRPCPAIGKRDCLILDHAGNEARHGSIEAPIRWSLERGAEKCERGQERQVSIAVGGNPREVEVDESVTLQCVRGGELAGESPIVSRQASELQKSQRFNELCAIAAKNGHRRGWIFHAYKGEFKEDVPKAWLTRGHFNALPIDPAPSGSRIRRGGNNSQQMEIHVA